MPYKKNSSGGGAAANITSQVLSSTIDTTNPLLPKLKLKSVIDQSGTIVNSNELLIDLEEINTTGASLSTDIGQRLILGSDSKPYEDMSGHLAYVYRNLNSINFFDTDPATATVDVSGYWEVIFEKTYTTNGFSLPNLPVGYKYVAETTVHYRAGNDTDKQPFPFKSRMEAVLTNFTTLGSSDSQNETFVDGVVVPAFPDINFNSKAISNSNAITSSSLILTHRFYCPNDFDNKYLLMKNLRLAELKYEIYIYIIKDSSVLPLEIPQIL